MHPAVSREDVAEREVAVDQLARQRRVCGLRLGRACQQATRRRSQHRLELPEMGDRRMHGLEVAGERRRGAIRAVDRAERHVQRRERRSCTRHTLDLVVAEMDTGDAREESGMARRVHVQRHGVGARGRQRQWDPERQIGVDEAAQDLVLETDARDAQVRVQPQHVLAGFAAHEEGVVADTGCGANDRSRSWQVPLIQDGVVHKRRMEEKENDLARFRVEVVLSRP